MPAATQSKEPVGAVEPTRLYRYEELAAFAGVSARQIRRWVESGWMSYVQLPQGRRVSGQQYLDFIEARAHAAEE
jgi:DNA-binding transcriptional MerR regulator